MTTGADIEIRGLTKSYGGHRVLDGIDLEIPAGSVTALLGPNGSGKTTTVGKIARILVADERSVVLGAVTAGVVNYVDRATLADMLVVLQRQEMVRRISEEIGSSLRFAKAT